MIELEIESTTNEYIKTRRVKLNVLASLLFLILRGHFVRLNVSVPYVFRNYQIYEISSAGWGDGRARVYGLSIIE